MQPAVAIIAQCFSGFWIVIVIYGRAGCGELFLADCGGQSAERLKLLFIVSVVNVQKICLE